MGLDMYLMTKAEDDSGSNLSGEDTFAAYWRKANQIHRWFVENVQDGVDECGTYPVSDEQLQSLYDLCVRVRDSIEMVEGTVNNGQSYKNGEWENITEKGMVVAQAGLAEKLLPSSEGFFFGGSDYDQYYMMDIESTIDQLEPLLGGGTLYYHASW